MLAEGEFAQVRQHLEEALKHRAEWVGDHDLYAILADAAAQQRDAVALQQYAPLAEETANRYNHTLYQAIAHRAWGVAHRLAGEYEEAAIRLGQALDLFEQLETRWQMGRTLAELAELGLAQKNTGQAREHYSRAVAIFEDIKAMPDAMQIRKALSLLS